MARYTSKPYGLTIGSGMFHTIDPDNTIHDFPAILSFETYAFQMFSSAHVGIKTPAEALCWRTLALPMPTLSPLPTRVQHCVPAHWFERWLDTNTPGWTIRPANASNPLSERIIFFTKRGHALACAQQIATMLKGAPTRVR